LSKLELVNGTLMVRIPAERGTTTDELGHAEPKAPS
jgi:hypothetical protein